MSQPFVPGPVPVYVAPAGTPVFLGFAERGVDLDLNPVYSDYFVDVAGGAPLDHCYQGETAVISMVLSSWREAPLQVITDYAGIFAGSTRGFDIFGEIGTLMGFEGAAYPMYLPFPYASKSSYSTMPAGYRFPLVFLDRQGLPDRGAKPAKMNLTFRAVRQVLNLSPSGGSPLSQVGLLLYDHNMSAVAGLNLN